MSEETAEVEIGSEAGGAAGADTEVTGAAGAAAEAAGAVASVDFPLVSEASEAPPEAAGFAVWTNLLTGAMAWK